MDKFQIKPIFAFDEIVKIIDSKYDNVEILNSTGYIAGRVLDEDDKWLYDVFLFNVEEVWCFDEEALQSTGEFVPENFSFSGEAIKVIVDKDGKGHIK